MSGDPVVEVFVAWMWLVFVAVRVVRWLLGRPELRRPARGGRDHVIYDEARPGCLLCPDTTNRSLEEALDHFRTQHPDVYDPAADDVERWPDGGLVVVDMDLTPADFERPVEGR